MAVPRTLVLLRGDPLDCPLNEDSPGSAAPDRRRRVHDAGRPRAARALSRRPPSPISSSRRPHRSSTAIPTSTRWSSRRACPAWPDGATNGRSSAGCARTRFDLAIDFHGGPRASLLTWLSGAPMRIGYDVVGRSWMYTHAIGRPRALRARHSVENQWDLLAPLGIAPPDPTAHPVEMAVDPAAARDVSARLRAAGVHDADRLVVMHVSAGNPFRRWPIPAFAAVAAGLAARDAGLPHPRDVRARPSAPRPTGHRRRPRRAARARTRPHSVAAASSRSSELARAGRSRRALHRRRQRPDAHRRDQPRADGRSVRPDAAGAFGAVAGAGTGRLEPWRSTGCPAGRAISGSACPAISAA